MVNEILLKGCLTNGSFLQSHMTPAEAQEPTFAVTATNAMKFKLKPGIEVDNLRCRIKISFATNIAAMLKLNVNHYVKNDFTMTVKSVQVAVKSAGVLKKSILSMFCRCQGSVFFYL